MMKQHFMKNKIKFEIKGKGFGGGGAQLSKMNQPILLNGFEENNVKTHGVSAHMSVLTKHIQM